MKTIAAVLVVALALAACATSDDSSSDDTTTTTSVDVDAMLLVPGDLNSDDALDAKWRVGDVSEGVDIELPACIDEELLDPAPVDGKAKLVRETEFKLPSVEQHIGAWTGDGAKAVFDAAVARLDACDPQFTFEGAPSAGTIARLDLPAVGDAVRRVADHRHHRRQPGLHHVHPRAGGRPRDVDRPHRPQHAGPDRARRDRDQGGCQARLAIAGGGSFGRQHSMACR